VGKSGNLFFHRLLAFLIIKHIKIFTIIENIKFLFSGDSYKYKYKKYHNKILQIGGNTEYNFCALWLNNTQGDISQDNLIKINNFALLIQKYGKKLKFIFLLIIPAMQNIFVISYFLF